MNNVRRNLEQALNEAATFRHDVLEYEVDANGNEVPERTPNAPPAGPNDSNVVIFQMMLHYKRKLEDEQEINAVAMKKLKTQQDVIETRDDEIRTLRRANISNVNRLTQQHNAARRLSQCLQDMFETIELVRDTDMGESPEGFRLIEGTMDRQMGRAAIAIELMGRREPIPHDHEQHVWNYELWMLEHGEAALTDEEMQEVIDLTGEETEEEE